IQRPEPIRIPNTDERVLSEQQQRKCALDLRQRFAESIEQVVTFGSGKQMQDDLAVARGLKDGTLLFEPIAERLRIDQISVIDHGYRTASANAFDDDRLGIALAAVAGS